ncbi:hypothetical protein INR49_008073, partial [Caranx melampygus]
MPNSGADILGRRLASELLLGLASQRGSLRYLLEWIEMALAASAVVSTMEQSKVLPNQEGLIGYDCFMNILMQMRRSLGSSADRSQWREPTRTSDGLCSLYEAALCLFEEVCRMASDYSRTCVSPDSIQTGEAPVVSETCEVYVWGSNSSHQLIEAGQYCTFVISSDGSVRACGKGSYGRLGLGDSNNQSMLKKLTFEPHRAIKKVSSSKGSDGHTLAFTTEGEVFSWGDGDYGKLGHGNSSTQKYPNLSKATAGEVGWWCVSAGYRHSAAVSEDGELYTWGEGDFGRLGHGDSNSRNIPTLVKDISNVGEVSCGSSHTIALSKDGRTVWSFGGGDNAKVVEALQGMFIRKVCAGSQSSLALTSTGQVYAWGCGACLGCGSSEATALRPKLIEELATTRVVDISIGDSHCLALSHGELYGAITKPKKVVGLDGVAIQQISAGTSHSLAWTALPRDRQVVAWHRPYCVDLEESTFSHLRSFLERYCDGINSEVPPLPFPSSREHHNFLKLCLRLLSNHLALALAGGVATSILGRQARPLRNLLFRLMDSSVPDEIQERMQLDIILTSLQDHTHVASLLGYSSPADGPEVLSSGSALQHLPTLQFQQCGLLHKHLQLLLPHATDIFSRSATLIKESSWNGRIREKLQDVIYVSAAGSMFVGGEASAEPLVGPAPPLDPLNRLLPAASPLRIRSCSTSDFAEPASGMSLPQPALSWVWLVDLERTVALLVGRCLGGMLQGAPTSMEEQDTAYWLKTPLFSNGLEMDIPQLALSGNEEQKPFDCTLRPDLSVLVDLALVPLKNLPTASGSTCRTTLSASNESLLDTVSRFVLAALLKHTGLLGQACGEGRYQPSKSLAEVYRSVYKISDNQDSLDMDPQEHSFTRTIDEEAELEERADREREEATRSRTMRRRGKGARSDDGGTREVARSRDRERASSSTGLGSGSGSGARRGSWRRRGGGGSGSVEEDAILSQEGRRGSAGLPEGQDLYTAACNSVIHRCALLVLGVSPVLGELTKQNQDEGQTQSATEQECLSFMT